MKWKGALVAALVLIMGTFLYKEYTDKDKYVIDDESQMDHLMPEVQAEANNMAEMNVGLGLRDTPPNIKLHTLDGQPFALNDYQGKIVVLNFWATWCPPCRAEMPDMQKFYEKYKDQGVEVVAVNLTSAENNQEIVQTFIDEFKIDFTVPLDKTGAVGQQFQAYSIPKSFIIDQEGRIQQGIIGPMTYSFLEEEVKKLQ